MKPKQEQIPAGMDEDLQTICNYWPYLTPWQRLHITSKAYY
ncbi:MAG TPA: hypothetical protein VGK00_03250 [Anaerolineales bacterium]|jgi:hypothetical protein